MVDIQLTVLPEPQLRAILTRPEKSLIAALQISTTKSPCKCRGLIQDYSFRSFAMAQDDNANNY
jgi:hypothetical protein